MIGSLQTSGNSTAGNLAFSFCSCDFAGFPFFLFFFSVSYFEQRWCYIFIIPITDNYHLLQRDICGVEQLFPIFGWIRLRYTSTHTDNASWPGSSISVSVNR